MFIATNKKLDLNNFSIFAFEIDVHCIAGIDVFSELQDFDLAILSLKHSGALVIADNFTHISDIAESKASPNAAIIQVKKSFNKHTTFYSQMFEPFLLAYWVSGQETVSMLNCQTRLLSVVCNFAH